MKLYSIFVKYDSTMIEINPLAEDVNGKGTFYNDSNTIFLSFSVDLLRYNLLEMSNTLQYARRFELAMYITIRDF